MVRGRTKGSKNTNSKLEGLVLSVKALNPSWSANRIRQHLVRKTNGTLSIPKLRTIQEILKRGKPKLGKVVDSDLDTAWALSKTPDLTSDAIAAIFEVQKWLETTKDRPMVSSVSGWTETMTNSKMSTTVWPLSTRDALWISKLYKVQYNLSPPEMLYLKLHKEPIVSRRPLIENPSKLWETAKTYADYQRLCDIVDIDFDTTPLDEALIKDIGTGRTKHDLFIRIIKEGKANERPHSSTEQE